jgi:putative ABC transport system permease protein
MVIAFAVAVPLIFFSMNAWLANYAFRIEFPFWVPVLALLFMAFFAFLTVGFQNLRVARMNPAEAIREE